MTTIDWIGIVAAILTTSAFIPQALKTLKTRSTDDISLLMYLGFVSGIILWLIYGFAIENMPIILGNAVTLIFAGIILFVKVRNMISEKAG